MFLLYKTHSVSCLTNYFHFISLLPAAHLRPPPRVAQNAKTLSAVSLMDCLEQGGGGSDGGGDATVLLESYQSTCEDDATVPLHPSPAAAPAIDKEATATMATVAIETAPLLSPSAAAKEEEEEEEKKKEPQPLTSAKLEEVKKEEGKIT